MEQPILPGARLLPTSSSEPSLKMRTSIGAGWLRADVAEVLDRGVVERQLIPRDPRVAEGIQL